MKTVGLIRIYGGFHWIENSKQIAKPPPADPGLSNEIGEVVVLEGYTAEWYGKETKPGCLYVTDYRLVRDESSYAMPLVRQDLEQEFELAILLQDESAYVKVMEKRNEGNC